MPKSAAIVIAVNHKEYKALSDNDFVARLNNGGSISDVKSMLDRDAFESVGVTVWRL